jgi:hypothetical protein
MIARADREANARTCPDPGKSKFRSNALIIEDGYVCAEWRQRMLLPFCIAFPEVNIVETQ